MTSDENAPMSDQESPIPADAANDGVRPDRLIQINLPAWMAVASILVGILFSVFAILYRDTFQDVADYRLTLCVGFGLVLSGLGAQASGRWRGWTIAGGGASAMVLYLLLYYTAAPPPPPSDPGMIVRIEGGFHPETSAVQVEGHDNTHLFTAWGQVNTTLKVRLLRKNIGNGCIGFVVYVRSPENQSTVDNATFVPAAFFGGAIESDAAVNGQEIAVLNYRHESNALFRNVDSEEPISFDRCPPELTAVSGSTRVAASPFLLDLLAPKAWAGEEFSIKALIDGFRASNAMVRREARQLLGAKGLDAVRPTMDTLARQPNEYRVQRGAVSMLSGLLATKVDPAEVRILLTDQDIAHIVPLVAHDDDTMRRTATSVIMWLADPRAIGHLIAILGGNSNQGRYDAAQILNRNYDSYDLADQQSLPGLLEPVFAAQTPQTRKLLQKITAPGESISATEGWAYVGINYGKVWVRKLFSWPGDGDTQRLPQIGDILTATGNINLRRDHIRYKSEKGWVNAPTIGTIRPGDKLRVTDVKIVALGFHWVEVVPGG